MKRFDFGHGITNLTGEIKELGEDLVVHIYGGSHPHIGAVALGIPRPSLKNPEDISSTVSILTMMGHKDDHLAREAADFLAASLNKNVVVVAGFHIDNAGDEQIKEVLRNCRQLLVDVIKHYKKN